MPHLPHTMSAITYDCFGPPEVLRLSTVPLPVLRPSDALVRVLAAGINRAELNWRQGRYGTTPGFGDSDQIIGLEMAGEVVALGPEASGLQLGDRVMGIVGGGGYAQYARIDAGMAMPIPESISDIEAAAIPEALITAHHALLHLGGLKPGQSVLIHGAGGGVGTSLVQLAKLAGAGAIVTTSSAGKRAALQALGASLCIAYQQQDFAEQIKTQIPGGLVDLIIDNMGAPYLERNIRSLAPGGRLIQLGLQGGAAGAVLPLDLVLQRRLRIEGTVMKSLTTADKRAMTQRFAQRWMPALARRELLPIIDKTLPLAEAAQAHARMEASAHFGKIVLQVPHPA